MYQYLVKMSSYLSSSGGVKELLEKYLLKKNKPAESALAQGYLSASILLASAIEPVGGHTKDISFCSDNPRLATEIISPEKKDDQEILFKNFTNQKPEDLKKALSIALKRGMFSESEYGRAIELFREYKTASKVLNMLKKKTARLPGSQGLGGPSDDEMLLSKLISMPFMLSPKSFKDLTTSAYKHLFRSHGFRFSANKAEEHIACTAESTFHGHMAILKTLVKRQGLDYAMIPQASFDGLNAALGVIEKPIFQLKLNEQYKVDPVHLKEQLEKNSGSGVLVITNPTNPFSVYYTKAELEELALIAKEHDLTIINDEHFFGLQHDQDFEPVSLSAICPDAVTIRGVNKHFGKRYKLGFIVSNDKQFIADVKLELDLAEALPSKTEYRIWRGIFNEGISSIPETRGSLSKRKELVLDLVEKLNEGLSTRLLNIVVPPENGFFTCLSMPRDIAYKYGIVDDISFNAFIAANTGVVTRSVQGMAIDDQHYFHTRINIIDLDEMQLRKNFDVLREFLVKIDQSSEDLLDMNKIADINNSPVFPQEERAELIPLIFAMSMVGMLKKLQEKALEQ